jgi:integrase
MMAGTTQGLLDVGGNGLVGVVVDAAAEAKFGAVVKADMPDLANKGTATAYRNDVKAYAAWCRTNKVKAVPAGPAQLGAYVKHLITTPAVDRGGRKGPRSPRSIDRAIAAVQALHRDKGFGRVDTVHARAYLNAYEHQLSTAKHRAARVVKAKGATRTHIRRMLDTLDRDTLRGKRDAAVLLLGYSILGRASETAALSFDSVELVEGGMTISVYRQKTKRWTDTPVPRQQDRDVCPVVAFEQLRDALAAKGVTSGPLFRSIDRHGVLTTNTGRPPKDAKARKAKEEATAKGAVSPITTATVTNIVKGAAKDAGLAAENIRWSGHSLRRGGAQDIAASPKATRERLEEAGGWKTGSVAVGEYLNGTVSMADALVQLDEEQADHCDTCTCHGPVTVDGDVLDVEAWDAEVLD